MVALKEIHTKSHVADVTFIFRPLHTHTSEKAKESETKHLQKYGTTSCGPTVDVRKAFAQYEYQ